MSRHLRIMLSVFIVLFMLIVSACGPGDRSATSEAMDVEETAETTAARDAVQWLRGRQESDGSFPAAFGHPAAMTLDALLAGAAVGDDVSEWRTGEQSALDYLAATMDEYATGPDTTGKLIAGVVAAGEDPRDFGQTDLVRWLMDHHDGMGSFGEGAVQQSWALLGLAAADAPVETPMIDTLLAMQTPEGGWDSGWGVDADTTALALQALAAAGVSADHEAIVNGVDYLRTQQAATGGFFSFGTDSNPNTTAFAIQALVAVGEDPRSDDWARDGQTPVQDLLRFQLADGSFEYAPGDGSNLYATVQAVPALMERPFPIK